MRSAVFMTLIWLVLADGNAGSLLAGLPFAAIAAALWLALVGRANINLRALALFSFFFAWQSLLAGIDVAMRVFRPGLPVNPAVMGVRLRLPDGASRVFLAAVTNLLPGTLKVDVSGDTMELHVLDETAPLSGKMRQIEDRVAAIFKIDLAGPEVER